MRATKIEWTDATWNPIVGCSVVSPGCTNCYAMKMAARVEATGTVPHYAGLTKRVNGNVVWTGRIAVAPNKTLTEPLRRRKATRYFVNSMSDLFHEAVPDDVIDRVFAVMALCPQHTFQVLTKRPERMRRYFSGIENGDGEWLDGEGWRDALIEGTAQALYAMLHPKDGDPSLWLAVHGPLPNVWLGTSVEDQRRADERIPELLATPAAVRFISAEPLLGPIDLSALPSKVVGWKYDAGRGLNTAIVDGELVRGYPGSRLHRVIVGGESGPGARPMHPDWARSLRDQCASAGMPFFMKQMAKKAEIPADLFIREMPRA